MHNRWIKIKWSNLLQSADFSLCAEWRKTVDLLRTGDVDIAFIFIEQMGKNMAAKCKQAVTQNQVFASICSDSILTKS